MERVNFETIIGKFVDKETGKAYNTTMGTIRYSKDGTHSTGKTIKCYEREE